MQRLVSVVLLGLTLQACSSTQSSLNQQAQQSAPDYQKARAFLPGKLTKKVKDLWFTPQWVGDKGDFWFTQSSGDEVKYLRFNAAQQSIDPLFDESRLYAGINQLNGVSLDDSEQVLVSNLEGNKLTLNAADKDLSCDLQSYQCQLEEQAPDLDGISPDKKFQLRLKGFNIELCDLSVDKCSQLTSDGSESAPYAIAHPYPEKFLDDPDFKEPQSAAFYWSDNGRYAVSYKLFREGVNKLTLMDSIGGDYAVKAANYYYPQAGDKHLPMVQLVLIDTKLNTAKLIDAPKVMQTYYGWALWGKWQGDNFYYHDRRRGNREYFIRKLDTKTAKLSTLIKETDPEYIDPWVQVFEVLDKRNQYIWSSQRSGYQHLYLYDSDGKLLNPITQGDYTVRVIRGIDQKAGVVYFEASGMDDGRDPYQRSLYKINLDGTGLTLLTPELYEHSTRVSPDFKWIVDQYSDTQTVPVTVLRDAATGKIVKQLQKTNADELFATGWQPPEPFNVLADDGKTQLYGLIYKPRNFDATKSYPVIDDTYTGPHNFFTAKSFATFNNQRAALAELGFIVIKMDGRGTNKRGREFHRQSYKNLAAGTDDHVWAIKQLAKTRPYMDTDRVGIFGFSAGGYDTMQAMLRHPGFFKAGVSASGNHDFRVDKAGWNEIWMGWPVTEHWDQQSNYTDLHRLKGKLLLAHGELDSNVHPAATMRLVDALIKENKDFDLLIMPKMGHVLDRSQYFVEKRWRFFVEHLLNVTP